MNDAFVVNASPLIILSKAGLLPILPRVVGQVRTTRIVIDEVLAKPEDASVADAIRAASWLEVVPQGSIYPARITKLRPGNLGRGEISVMRAVFDSDVEETTAVLDDLAARRTAAALGIACIGTLGVLVRAQQRRVLPSALDAIDAVIRAGLYISPKLLAELRQRLRA